MYSVSYRNNLDRVPAQVIDGSITPKQFIENNGVSLGNYALQLNGIALSFDEQNSTFDQLVSTYGLDGNTEIILAGVKPSNGGNK